MNKRFAPSSSCRLSHVCQLFLTSHNTFYRMFPRHPKPFLLKQTHFQTQHLIRNAIFLLYSTLGIMNMCDVMRQVQWLLRFLLNLQDRRVCLILLLFFCLLSRLRSTRARARHRETSCFSFLIPFDRLVRPISGTDPPPAGASTNRRAEEAGPVQTCCWQGRRSGSFISFQRARRVSATVVSHEGGTVREPNTALTNRWKQALDRTLPPDVTGQAGDICVSSPAQVSKVLFLQ